MQLQAKLDQAARDWDRAEALHPTKAIADTDYDLAVANYKTAKANVAVGEATIKQNEAALDMAKTNLDYTTIKSPVDGVIIDRRVNIGQTVVSSLNAPSLFSDRQGPAADAGLGLGQRGRHRPHPRLDMPVRFTVDAYPGESFRGKVIQIRLNATMTQNVVTYTVVVETDNSDGRLLPYLTANVQFEVEAAHRTSCWCPTRRCAGSREAAADRPRRPRSRLSQNRRESSTARTARTPRKAPAMPTQPSPPKNSRARPHLGRSTGSSSGRST